MVSGSETQPVLSCARTSTLKRWVSSKVTPLFASVAAVKVAVSVPSDAKVAVDASTTICACGTVSVAGSLCTSVSGPKSYSVM